MALEALLQAGHEIVLVLTQPDRPSGRGLQPRASAVKQLALSQQLPVLQPVTLRDPALATSLAALHAEVMVVAAYGLLLPETILKLPPRGCLNIHASLLPRWRGAAPIQRAILAGDSETGVTIMQMDAGLDTGAMLLAEKMPIMATDTAQTLHDKLAALGGQLIIRALHEAPPPVNQDAARATHAAKISKAEALIDWNQPAADIDRLVRAFNPAPGAVTSWHGQNLKIWRSTVIPATGAEAGTVIHAEPEGIDVMTGAGALRLLELQRAGGKRLAPQAFLAGVALKPGERFGG